MKYDVFISYSSHDQKVVAYRDIPRGVVWADAIVEALDESRMMVVVFSENFNNSAQVNREIELASEDGKHILTYRLNDIAFRGAKKYYLKNLNWIDAFPNPEQTFGSVAEGVAKLLGLKLKKVVKVEKVLAVAPTPKPTPTPAPNPTHAPNLTPTSEHPLPNPTPALESTLAPKPIPTPAPKPTPTPTPTPKKPYPNYLWALALMPLVLIGLWLGIDSYQEKQAVLREQQAQELAEAIAEGKGRDGIYQVGDYYNRNGKQGVVFEVSDSGRHGKIVSLEQSQEELQWCSDEEYKRDIETGASDERNGMNNQRIIQQISGWREKYPAFAYCADQGEGWYPPAIEELKQFTLNDAVHDAVNRTLQAKGGTKLFDKGDSWKWYWSSTEGTMSGARYVNVGSGYATLNTKTDDYYVRAVSAF